MERTGEPAASSERVRLPSTRLTYTFEEFAALYRDDLELTKELKEAAERLNLYKPHPVLSGGRRSQRSVGPESSTNEAVQIFFYDSFSLKKISLSPVAGIHDSGDDKRKRFVRGVTNHSQGQGPVTMRKPNRNVAAQRTSELIRSPRLDWLNAEPIRRVTPARTGTSKPAAFQALKKSFEDLRISKVRATPYVTIPTSVDMFHSLKKFVAEVTVVYNPTYFYVVPLVQRQLYQMNMEAAFNRILNGPIFATSYDPMLHGNFCCVRTAQLEFSRGYCYEFDPRINTAKVYFIDSGMRRSVRKECVLPMPRELLAIPLLAAHCSLLGSTHPGDGRGQQTEFSFMKQVSKKRFLVVVHWHSHTCIVPGLSVPSLCVDLIEEEQEKPVYDGSITAADKYAN